MKFARACVPQVTRQYIDRLVKLGKLPQNDDGTIPVKEGLAAMQLLNPAATLDLDAVEGHDRKVKKKKARANATALKSARVALDLRMSQLKERRLKEQLLSMELKKLSGELVPLSVVSEDAETIAEVVRSRLLAIPPRLALAFGGLIGRTSGTPSTAEVEALLREEIIDVMGAIQRGRFMRGPVGERVWVCGKCGE